MVESNQTLQIDEIQLRAWKPDDAQWYVESRDEEVFRCTTEDRNLTVDKAAESIRQMNESEDSFCFAIVDSNTGQMLGNIALVLDAGERDTGEVMFWLAPWARGRGVASRAVRLLCEWAFSELNLEKVTARTLRENTRSQQVLRSLGFEPAPSSDISGQSDKYLWFELPTTRAR